MATLTVSCNVESGQAREFGALSSRGEQWRCDAWVTATALFIAALSANSSAWAQCATAGNAPVILTCATDTVTVNATNSTSPNSSTNAPVPTKESCAVAGSSAF